MENENKTPETVVENENLETQEETPKLPQPEEKPLLEAPESQEDKTENVSVKEEDARAAAIDEMEKATQKALDAMREKGNPENEKVVEEAEDKFEHIFNDFSKKVQDNVNPESIKEAMKDFQDKVGSLLEKTRQGVIEVSKNEDFRKTMESGKNFVVGTAGLIGDGLKYGYDKLLEIPEFKSLNDKLNSKVDELRHNETLKNAVDRSEEGLSSFATSLFGHIKSFFDDSKPQEEKLPELPAEANEEPTEEQK